MFVSQRARTFLEGVSRSFLSFLISRWNFFTSGKLRGSKYKEDVDHMTRCFDKTTKLTFRNSGEPSYIRFGTARDRDPSVDIRSGQMKLPGCVSYWITHT